MKVKMERKKHRVREKVEEEEGMDWDLREKLEEEFERVDEEDEDEDEAMALDEIRIKKEFVRGKWSSSSKVSHRPKLDVTLVYGHWRRFSFLFFSC